MNKSDSLTIGREHGTTAGLAYIARVDNALQLDRQLVKTCCNALCSDATAPKGVVKAFYTEAFLNAFMAAWDHAYNAQPDVIARRRVHRLLDYCEGQVARGQVDIDTFAAHLTEDRWDAAFNAFEWADNATEAAASIKVARRVLAWYEQSTDYDTVVAEVRRSVQHAARFPKHSTSMLSNHMAQCEMAAYAAVLEVCER
jgi:hypothetical protein